MNDQYYLPKETAQLLTSTRVQQCRNLGLLLDKYPPRTAIDESKGKSNWLKGFELDNHIDTRLAEHVYTRWRSATAAMQAEHFTATTQWRMVVGLGGETVLETDMTLHHLYGIPYIPGSALKGLTRAYVTGEVFPSKDIEHDNETVKRIFGSQEHAGTVIFFDAMPVDGKATLALDIMNSHYPNYYGEKKPPTNDQNPNPVTFLTVTNTAFMFALAPRNPRYIDDVNTAKDWLQKALEKYGVGGKTSAGYGYFRKADDKDMVVASPASVQTVQTPQTRATQENWQRPNIQQFREGQEIQNCVVIPPTEMMLRYYPKASAFLRYKEFPAKYIFVVIEDVFSEAQNWISNESKSCIFIREEQHEGSLVLVCKPKPPRNKDKKK